MPALLLAVALAGLAGCARNELDEPKGAVEPTATPARLGCETDGLVTAPTRKDSNRLFAVPSPSSELLELDRRTLRVRPGGRIPLKAHAGSAALAPNGRRLALASGLSTELQIVDLARMRVRSHMRLRAPGPLQWLAWAGPSRILAIAQSDERRSRVLIVDLARRQVVRERTLPGVVQAAEPTGGGLALLLSPAAGIGPSTLTVVDRRGAVCSIRLTGILSGYEEGRREGDGERPLRQQIPGFAIDRDQGRAFVVSGGLTVAVVDLPGLRVRVGTATEQVSVWKRMRDWLEPEAAAKLIDGPQREAVYLGNDRIAVTGADYTTDRTDTTAGPLGLKVIDTRKWRVETVDEETSHVLRYGDTLFATVDATGSRGARLRAYDLGGALLFELRSRFELWVAETAAGRVYVYEDGGRLYRRVDPATGRATRVRPRVDVWLVGGTALG